MKTACHFLLLLVGFDTLTYRKDYDRSPILVGHHPSTGPPTYQIIKVPNANHMNVMKTSLTIIPMCPRERFSLYKSLSRLVLCYKKDWAILLHTIYFHYLLLVANYLLTKLSVTDNFSACREYLTKNCLSFPYAPRWVRHSYLSKGLR